MKRIREGLGEAGFGDDPRFRWRGGDVSRLEEFSDIVFAFAMTLLVVALEAPRSFPELLNIMKGFLSFGVSFLFLFFLWYQHYLFFRRYGLNDFSVVVINGVLMFLVIFFVYPFQFLVTLVVNLLILKSFLGLDVPVGLDLSTFQISDYRLLHSLYAIAFAAIAICYALLYRKAMGEAERLELNALEAAITHGNFLSFLIVVVIALASIVLVNILPLPWAPHVAGWIFVLIWPATWFAEHRLVAPVLAAEKDAER